VSKKTHAQVVLGGLDLDQFDGNAKMRPMVWRFVAMPILGVSSLNLGRSAKGGFFWSASSQRGALLK
jgi:hypothetical protein